MELFTYECTSHTCPFFIVGNIFGLFTVFFEPTDRRKAVKPFINKQKITFTSPNRAELIAIAQTLEIDVQHIEKTSKDNGINIDEVLNLSIAISDYVDLLLVTLGVHGVITVKKIKNGNLICRLYNVEKIVNVKNVSGAGDCFASGFINGILSGLEEDYCVAMAVQIAHQALLSETTVPINFNNCKNLSKSNYINLI